MTDNVLIIHPRDNVAVAMRKLTAGEQLVAKGFVMGTVLEDILASHKVALVDIAQGDEIVKYGETVAVSTRAILEGAWVHTHNLESKRWKK